MSRNRLALMPYLALVLSFVAVLGIGRLVGPAEAEPGDGGGVPAPTAAPVRTPVPVPLPTRSPTPTRTPPPARASEPAVPSVSSGPTAGSTAPVVGPVTVDLVSLTADPALPVTRQQTADGRLQVCVALPAGTTIEGDDSWQQHDPPTGRTYCTEVARTVTTVRFDVVPR